MFDMRGYSAGAGNQLEVTSENEGGELTECIVCHQIFIDHTIEEKNAHLNSCITEKERGTSERIDNCIICKVNLFGQTERERHEHICGCADRLEKKIKMRSSLGIECPFCKDFFPNTQHVNKLKSHLRICAKLEKVNKNEANTIISILCKERNEKKKKAVKKRKKKTRKRKRKEIEESDSSSSSSSTDESTTEEEGDEDSSQPSRKRRKLLGGFRFTGTIKQIESIVTVEDWLKNLQLSNYLEHFTNFGFGDSLQKFSTLSYANIKQVMGGKKKTKKDREKVLDHMERLERIIEKRKKLEEKKIKKFQKSLKKKKRKKKKGSNEKKKRKRKSNVDPPLPTVPKTSRKRNNSTSNTKIPPPPITRQLLFLKNDELPHPLERGDDTDDQDPNSLPLISPVELSPSKFGKRKMNIFEEEDNEGYKMLPSQANFDEEDEDADDDEEEDLNINLWKITHLTQTLSGVKDVHIIVTPEKSKEMENHRTLNDFEVERKENYSKIAKEEKKKRMNLIRDYSFGKIGKDKRKEEEEEKKSTPSSSSSNKYLNDLKNKNKRNRKMTPMSALSISLSGGSTTRSATPISNRSLFEDEDEQPESMSQKVRNHETKYQEKVKKIHERAERNFKKLSRMYEHELEELNDLYLEQISLSMDSTKEQMVDHVSFHEHSFQDNISSTLIIPPPPLQTDNNNKCKKKKRFSGRIFLYKPDPKFDVFRGKEEVKKKNMGVMISPPPLPERITQGTQTMNLGRNTPDNNSGSWFAQDVIMNKKEEEEEEEEEVTIQYIEDDENDDEEEEEEETLVDFFIPNDLTNPVELNKNKRKEGECPNYESFRDEELKKAIQSFDGKMSCCGMTREQMIIKVKTLWNFFKKK